MPEYLITWKVDVEADSPEEAAREALAIQRDRTSDATVFEVQEVTYPEPGRWVLGDPVEVDL